MSTPYIALYPSDYLADTAHLGLTEHGVYWRMLLHYYQHCKPFPNDLEKINRVILAASPEEKRITEYILAEFFILKTHEDGSVGWHHTRADWEICAAEARHISAVERGKRGGRPRKKAELKLSFTSAKPELKLSLSSTKAEPKQPEPEPELEKEEEEKTYTRADALLFLKNNSVDQKTATDWLAVRKAKKQPPTKTALLSIVTEAGKAGMTMQDAIHLSTINGWAGFKASWIDTAKSSLSHDSLAGAV